MMDAVYDNRLRKSEWVVKDCDFKLGKTFVEVHHYSRGGSKQKVYMHGLFNIHRPDDLMGVAWWLPPTRVACESVNREQWKKVLSLTRLAIHPDVPKNACTFLMARSMKLIKDDGRFVSLVTYADESQNHTGAIYRASNWKYEGRTGPYTRWIDPATGKQVSAKATVNRRVQQMRDLGYVIDGRFYKHKFVKHLVPT